MPLETATLTLTTAAQGDSLSGAASQNGAALGKKGILEMIIQNPAGNGTVQVGIQLAGSFTSTPYTIPAGASTLTIGPFEGASYTQTSEWFFKGTNGNVLTIFLISH